MAPNDPTCFQSEAERNCHEEVRGVRKGREHDPRADERDIDGEAAQITSDYSRLIYRDEEPYRDADPEQM